jgi:hypothetical protein
MSDSLAKELAEYFAGERKPMPVYALAKQYAGEAKFNLEWTSATSEQSVAAIRRAAELGLVDIVSDIVYPAKPVQQAKPDTQMELF